VIQVKFERENVNDEFVLVTKIHKTNADRVESDECVLEVETSKTIKEILSPATGRLVISLNVGDEVAVGGILFEIDSDEADTALALNTARDSRHTGAESGPLPDNGNIRQLSKAAQQIVDRSSLDINRLPTGWVTSEDVLALTTADSAINKPGPAIMTNREPDSARSDLPKTMFRHERTSIRKRTEARNLGRANGSGNLSMLAISVAVGTQRLSTPPFLFFDSIADLVVFEASRLLHSFAELNGFHLDDRTIGLYDEINFGISFDNGRNLKVLAMQNSDQMSLVQIQEKFESLLHLYEKGDAIPDDLMTTSTVTLSDLSRSGISHMLPLLNANQALILGITRSGDGGFIIYASFDHRVSEGLRVARFLTELRARIESHFRAKAPSHGFVEVARCSVCDRSVTEEKSNGGRGLLKLQIDNGSDGFICRACFEGW